MVKSEAFNCVRVKSYLSISEWDFDEKNGSMRAHIQTMLIFNVVKTL